MDDTHIVKDELIGRDVTITSCTDPGWVRKTGRILDETKNTFLIKIKDQKKIIAKETAIFEFEYGGKKITLDGSKIAFRPEDRIKKVR